MIELGLQQKHMHTYMHIWMMILSIKKQKQQKICNKINT